MDVTTGANSDAVQRQRLARMLRDPDGYFAQARREAREHAKRSISQQLDAQHEQ